MTGLLFRDGPCRPEGRRNKRVTLAFAEAAS